MWENRGGQKRLNYEKQRHRNTERVGEDRQNVLCTGFDLKFYFLENCTAVGYIIGITIQAMTKSSTEHMVQRGTKGGCSLKKFVVVKIQMRTLVVYFVVSVAGGQPKSTVDWKCGQIPLLFDIVVSCCCATFIGGVLFHIS